MQKYNIAYAQAYTQVKHDIQQEGNIYNNYLMDTKHVYLPVSTFVKHCTNTHEQ
jgi:hypothetical protein